MKINLLNKRARFIVFCTLGLSSHVSGQVHLNSANTSGIYTAPNSIFLDPGFSTAPGQTFQASISTASVLTPSFGHNYIQTFVPRQAGILAPADPGMQATSVSSEIEYLDEMGRPVQSTQIRASPSQNDIIQLHIYDFAGREAIKYMPYTNMFANPSLHAAFHDAAIDEALYFHQTVNPNQTGIQNTSYPFAKAYLESSETGRVLDQGEVGEAWQLHGENPFSGHTTKMAYHSGESTVALYRVTIDATTGARTLNRTNDDFYSPVAKLAVTELRDQNWVSADNNNGLIKEYKALDGKVLLKRQYIDNGKGAGLETYSTYYVYDDFGNLCYVLPPKSEPDMNGAITQAVLDDLCYQYKYDGRQRLVEKKLPGKGWEYVIYNKLDQPIMTQDPRQRAMSPQQWTITKYDAQGRIILTGLYTYTGSANTNYRTAVQSAADALTPQFETRLVPATGNGYTANTYPVTWATTLSINYYDDYNFPVTNPYPYAANTGLSRGLLTASRINVLGTSDMLWTVNYYDKQGRVIRSDKQHYKGGSLVIGNYDEYVTTYNFTGTVASNSRVHKVAGTTALTALVEFEYDHEDRVTKTWETINSGTRTLLSMPQYTDLGNLWKEQLHSTDNGANFITTTTNTYNERNWLTSVNTTVPTVGGSPRSLMSVGLQYNGSSGIPQYNGNISIKNEKKLLYDKLNRLVGAVALNSGPVNSEEVSYDKNGNILTMARGNVTYGPLTYTYKSGGLSNQLSTVSGTGFSRSYNYDENGNATSDGGAKSITYNLLDLPSTIKTGTTLNADYTYSATGEKLKSTEYGSNPHVTEYIDGLVYQDGTLGFVQTSKGNATNNGTAFIYNYDLKDNLGNVMVTITNDAGTSKIIQSDDYYAFGLRVPKFLSGHDNRYLYNGKEIQTPQQLENQYDYGARFYDPVIGRWTGVDPLAEQYRKWSPYNYGVNDPIRFVDPDGMGVEGGPGSGGPQDQPKRQSIQQRFVDWINNLTSSNPNANKQALDDAANNLPGAGAVNYLNHFMNNKLTLGDVVWASSDGLYLAGSGLEGKAFSNEFRAVDEGFTAVEAQGSYSYPAAASKEAGTTAVEQLQTYSLEPTHSITKSRGQMAKLKADIRENGIQEPIKYVENDGIKSVVDGHHRLRIAKELGHQTVPAQQVQLPYMGYKNIIDLLFTHY